MKNGRITLYGSDKGGTGKTTGATNLAAILSSRGRDCLFLDADRQESGSGWCYTRNKSSNLHRIACFQKFGKGLTQELNDLSKRYQDIIVDTGGHDSIELRAAMSIADVMISPIQASQFDLWTLKNLDELVSQAKIFNPKLRVILVISRASTHHSEADTAHAAELVSDYERFVLSKTIIRDRVIYRRAAALGMGVHEFPEPNEKATQEMFQLYEEVFNND